MTSPIVIFCDGACSGNPGPGGWGVIIAQPLHKTVNVVELGGYESSTTNNRMELTGAIKALAHIREDAGTVLIYTDSTYVIRGITQWIFAWRQRQWKTAEGADVTNQDLWEKLYALVMMRKRAYADAGKIEWHYVRGHVGTPGNERVDEIAVAYCKKRHIDLFSGSLLNYGVAVMDLPEDTSLPEMKPKKEKTTAYSYLSLVDGKLERHATWTECERRVKGRSGAKFKKATSEGDEQAIMRSWGL